MKRTKIEKGVTLVAANTEVVGEIHFDDQLYINGKVTGTLIGDGGGKARVVISEEGSVVGDVRVPNIIINGRVEGNVYADVRVELASKARVLGDLHYRLMQMELGAKVDGQMVHQESASAEVHAFPGESRMAD
ncbi:MAG: polymer-forming cytoskeletal protein [Proteobacteria bacterium]|nr:polymer-forming cytoskeletal protein [Pseudomonadota bacterium]